MLNLAANNGRKHQVAAGRFFEEGARIVRGLLKGNIKPRDIHHEKLLAREILAKAIHHREEAAYWGRRLP